MHPFLDYILKANLQLIFFGLFYLIFLKKETFYQLNRWYFIGSIIVAITAPLVTFTKTVLVDPVPIEYFTTDNQIVVINDVVEEQSFLETIDLQQTSVYLILFISFILIIRKIYAVAKLYRSIKKLPSLGVSNIKISADNKTVYSFYQWIVVPENFFQWQNHKMILDHESIHLNQKHTFDLILVEIVAAVFWFNPLVKVIQRAINTNLEFIVDQKMIETTESVLYQKNLLSFQTQHAIQFVNSYNASEIKNRILQINSKKSTNMKKLKFLLATPALVAFFALFQIETVAQVTETIEVQEVFENDEVEDSFYVMIHSKYDDEYYKRTVKMLREKCNLDVTIDNLKRNKDGELTDIRITCKNNKPLVIGNYNINSVNAFEPFSLHIYKKDTEYALDLVSDKVEYTEIILDEEDGLSFNAETLKTNKEVFNEVVAKFPIVIDGVPFSKKQLKKFDNSKIQSMNWNVDPNAKKRMTLLLSTKKESHIVISLTPQKYNVIMPSYKESDVVNNLLKHNKTVIIKDEQKKIKVINDKILKVEDDSNNSTRAEVKGTSTQNLLYVVDGDVVMEDNIRKIDQKDIETITILKDQQAKEKYGQKGKDGVIVITTKAKKEVSLQQKRQALKTRELAMKQRNEAIAKRNEIEKSRQQLLKKRNEISEKTQQRRKELEEQREKLLAKRKETIVVSNKKSDKNLLNDDYKTLTDIFNDVNKTVKDVEDENFKITSVRASIIREDGTKVELAEVY